MAKKALITGVTGQDDSHLAELLLDNGYSVFDIVIHRSSINTPRIDHPVKGYHSSCFDYCHVVTNDRNSLINIIQTVKPDGIYHLMVQSHVKTSFEMLM